MNFLNPLFLFGLAAAAIPIVIHLFTRKRPREVRFSSLEFLSEVNRSEIRRIQLKQWLLLLLRTLAIVALALAMGRPVLRAGAAARNGAGTTVVALVDRSGSMGALARGGPRIAEARRLVESLLATLGPSDDLLLVPYDDQPEPVSQRPISDVPRLRGAAQELEARARTTDHRAALLVAARALGESHALNRELFWLSDFQAAGFGDAEDARPPALPDGPWSAVRTYLVPLGPERDGNAGLVEAALAPAEGAAALSVSAVSHGAPAGDLAVSVTGSDGGELGRGFLPLPERGEASALVPLSRMPEQGGVASIADDVLPLDNRRFFASGRAGLLRVALREDGPPSPLRIALQAGSPASGLAVEGVEAGALPSRIGEADVVVLNDLERLGPTELQALLDYRRGGGALFLVLGNHADPAFWNSALLPSLGLGVLGAVEQAPAGAAWRLRRRAAGHPALAGFPARPGEPLSSARFTTVAHLTPGPGARVVLEFDRDKPALVETDGTLAFLAPLDVRSSDFPVSGAFLPLLHQIVRVLGRGTASPSLRPGDRYVAPAQTGTWRIEDERGRALGSELVTAGGATRLVSAPVETPGLYRVLQSGQPRASFAVNPDPREFDLTPVAEAELARLFPAGHATVLKPGADLERRVREARFGRELWSWFLAAALACLLAETLLGRSGLPGASASAPPPPSRSEAALRG